MHARSLSVGSPAGLSLISSTMSRAVQLNRLAKLMRQTTPAISYRNKAGKLILTFWLSRWSCFSRTWSNAIIACFLFPECCASDMQARRYAIPSSASSLERESRHVVPSSRSETTAWVDSYSYLSLYHHPSMITCTSGTWSMGQIWLLPEVGKISISQESCPRLPAHRVSFSYFVKVVSYDWAWGEWADLNILDRFASFACWKITCWPKRHHSWAVEKFLCKNSDSIFFQRICCTLLVSVEKRMGVFWQSKTHPQPSRLRTIARCRSTWLLYRLGIPNNPEYPAMLQ